MLPNESSRPRMYDSSLFTGKSVAKWRQGPKVTLSQKRPFPYYFYLLVRFRWSLEFNVQTVMYSSTLCGKLWIMTRRKQIVSYWFYYVWRLREVIQLAGTRILYEYIVYTVHYKTCWILIKQKVLILSY